MAWLDTMEDWKWMLGNWDRVLEAQECIRVLVALAFLRFLLGFWTAYTATQGGCVCIPAGGQAQAAATWYLNQKPSICFVPPLMQCATSYAEEAGIDLSGHKLKSIIVAGLAASR